MKRETVSNTDPQEMNSVTIMSFNEKHLEISSEQGMPAITTDRETYLSPEPAISRRTFLAAGAAVGGGLLLGQMAEASSGGGADGPLLKEYDIDTNGITLHVTEQGEGPAVLFCHGFPDTYYTWRRQMKPSRQPDIEQLLQICAAMDTAQLRQTQPCTRHCIRPVT